MLRVGTSRMIMKHWRAHMRTNLVIFLILALGLGIYLFCSTWTSSVVGFQVVTRVELGCDAVAVQPHWATYCSVPSMDLRVVLDPRSSAFRRSGYRKLTDGYSFPVETPWGFDRVVGLTVEGELRDEVWNGVVLVGGQLPEAAGDALVNAWAPVSIGETITLCYRHPFTVEERVRSYRVSGRYTSQDPSRTGVLMSRIDAGKLSQLPLANYFQLWVRDSVLMSRSETLDLIEEKLTPTRVSSFTVAREGTTLAGQSADEVALPFAFRVQPLLLHEGTPGAVVYQYTDSHVAQLTLAMGSVFLLMFLASTVMITVQVVETQRASGIYLVLGFEPKDVGRLYQLQTLVTFAGALPAGFLLALVSHRAVNLELPLSRLGGPLTLWGVFGSLLIFWAGRAAAILIGTCEPSDQLSQASSFDWWALIRLSD